MNDQANNSRSDLAAEAFMYGFPLLFDLQQVGRFAREGVGALPAAPFNVFAHATELAGPSDTFVSVNNDTVYSIAQVDVSGGPVRLDVPAAHGRYYVLQFVDAWTNNFAYVGRRATGTDAGSFLLVAPDWDGAVPPGVRAIRFPTAIASIVGRWAVDGVDDLPAVHALQQQLTLTPTADGDGLPQGDPAVPDGFRAFERLRVWMNAFPPAARDIAYQAKFAPLGLLDPGAASPYVAPDDDLTADLRTGLAAGKQQLEDALQHGSGPEVNGWQLTYHTFDYNLDFFELGALDDPTWKLDDTAARYLARSVAARAGLWGNHGYEAAYALTWVDGTANPLDGSHRYALRFETSPPVGAFWSVTMYDLPDFYLVANPIERYSIGDRTPGLHYADDGSLTILLQHEAPDTPEGRANWLPTPPGLFRPVLRMYEPAAGVFDGSYTLPPITRAG